MPCNDLTNATARPRRERAAGCLAVASVLAAALTSLPACRSRGAPARTAPPPTLVELAPVRSLPIEDSSEYVASIQSLSTTNIKPEVPGYVTKIFVKSGDRVGPGTPLFLIDARRQQASVSSQEAALAAQEAAAIFAKQQLDRVRMLVAAGAASRQELDQAQAGYDSAEAQLSALKARLQEERVTLQYYEVRAPAAGTVGDIPVRIGTRATLDTVLTSVDLNQALEVYVPVPLERSTDLRIGLPLQLVDGQGAKLAQTQVSFISPRVDDQTQTVLVKGLLNGSFGLRSSQFVRARLVWRTTPGLVIPLLSVVRINGQPFVFVAEEKEGRLLASQRLVRLGPIVGNDVVVVTGLVAGERIVASGGQKLDNGAAIRTS